jgi:ribosomal protein S13
MKTPKNPIVLRNLFELTSHYSGDFATKKLAENTLKNQLGYNRRNPLTFVKKQHYDTIENMLLNQINNENKRFNEDLNVNFLKSLGSYKSSRLRNGLPTRGQRTQTNARTSRRLGRGWNDDEPKATVIPAMFKNIDFSSTSSSDFSSSSKEEKE